MPKTSIKKEIIKLLDVSAILNKEDKRAIYNNLRNLNEERLTILKSELQKEPELISTISENIIQNKISNGDQNFIDRLTTILHMPVEGRKEWLNILNLSKTDLKKLKKNF